MNGNVHVRFCSRVEVATPRLGSGLRGRVGKHYTGTQRTRKAVHGECTVELAKWTFPIISLAREPYEAKVSRTGLTGVRPLTAEEVIP